MLAIAFVQIPLVERALLQLALASYCLPVIAIGPVLAVLFSGDTPKVILAALSVIFTTLIGTLVGLRSADRTSLDLIRAYGGGSWTQLWKVRLRASLPSMFAGLRIAAPAAMLGAIIGEYLGRRVRPRRRDDQLAAEPGGGTHLGHRPGRHRPVRRSPTA